jgi:hypothetical protein
MPRPASQARPSPEGPAPLEQARLAQQAAGAGAEAGIEEPGRDRRAVGGEARRRQAVRAGDEGLGAEGARH